MWSREEKEKRPLYVEAVAGQRGSSSSGREVVEAGYVDQGEAAHPAVLLTIAVAENSSFAAEVCVCFVPKVSLVCVSERERETERESSPLRFVFVSF
ncbi:hypothetical protein NL676_014360 [Syzygium grande]|nr:hypothetical protein NL676_014360 [Syzygium grande]